MIDLTECDGGNISFYKRLDEFIKGLEKNKTVDENSEISENSDIDDHQKEEDDNGDKEDDEEEDKENEEEEEAEAEEKDDDDDDDDDNEEDNISDMNELKTLLGKYTLQGNALKTIKIKKNLEEIINKENVLNLYKFK